jgi:hypothetical protein
VEASARVKADDPKIEADARLWRRIHQSWFVPVANSGEHRVSSQAFQNGRTPDGKPADHMSVTLADHPAAPASPNEAVSGKYVGYGLVEFSAGLARSLDQGVTHTPTTEEPAHGSVTGDKSRAVIDGFKRGSRLLIQPSPL